ncbi:MurR/RpiR family transcriptional regulator [Lactiplantibacillus plantarum]|uniref:MurR/RpiR family transcriptional regulator n=1 Tax=Lactiplantibacillus plantarum TaxID=1590 RepID=UPI0013671CE4|nr:MurR/RpiR family transcriptional regulator [Lactiplantibacillus plantarum]MDR7678627.1 MurR/RpiR family transcriptional regulator [Lactiplantibacillus plantarum]QHM45047.1 hypothetical protein C7M38_03217 [Lactiplantibacillus plantarum]
MAARDMLTYLNQHTGEDTQTRIIHFLFSHYRRLEYMTIIELAQRCYVSPASISRFVHRFGYPSFEEMKHSLILEMRVSEPNFTYRLKPGSMQQLRTSPNDFYHGFAEEISGAIMDTVATFSYESIDRLLHQIINAKQVVLFGFDTMLNTLRIFQSAMLSQGIVVQLGDTPEIQRDQTSQLDHDSLAVVFSSFGMFFSKCPDVYSAIVQSEAHTILITQMSGSGIYSNTFDECLKISSSAINAEAGSYPMEFLLDYMARRMFALKS